MPFKDSKHINYFMAGVDPETCHQVINYFAKHPQFRCAGNAVGAGEAATNLDSAAIDLLFLQVVSFDRDILEILRHKSPPRIVILSPTPAYAIQAFEYHAIVDYLLLPLREERFQTTLHRLLQRFGAAPARSPAAQERRILIKSQASESLINVSEIRYIFADGEYTRVCWGTSRNTILRKPIKQWVKELPSRQFVRIHRNALINLAFFERAQKLPNRQLHVFLRGFEAPLHVSCRMTSALHRQLKQFTAC